MKRGALTVPVSTLPPQRIQLEMLSGVHLVVLGVGQGKYKLDTPMAGRRPASVYKNRQRSAPCKAATAISPD